MMRCEKHIQAMPIDGCPICVREERDRLRQERDRLRDLIPQAWEAAQKRMTPNRSLVGAPPATFREWMEQKGLL